MKSKSCKDHAIDKPQTLIPRLQPLLIEVFSTRPHDSKAPYKGHCGLGELNMTNKLKQTRGVPCQTVCGLAIYGEKYFNAKGELWKSNNFTMQKYNLPKIL
jgi:hypothetical protein